jgi:hypothetical protein|tara:strand:+ start:23020 stop:23928 length:909 start_codon:yes stop_codon:yes gene_type:complete
MAGINTTGKANTKDYVLGRGIVYFASLDANGFPQAYEDLGNAIEFNMSLETETLEHQSSRGGLKVTDKEVPISQKLSVTLTLDEVNFGNLARFLSGSTSSRTNNGGTAITPTAADAVPSGGNLILPANSGGRWFDLYEGANGIVTGVTQDVQVKRIYDIGTVTVTGVNETTPTVTEGTDFEVDLKMGRFFVVDGGVLDTGSIQHLEVTVAANGSAAASVDVVKALTTTSLVGALKFIAENPADADRKTEYQFHQISLKAEGDFGLIADDWAQMQLNGVAEANSTADPDSTILTVTTPEPYIT